MSSDDDVPAPSPSAAELARRASREAKSMREEAGSEEDSDEPVENAEDDDEVSSEEDGSEKELKRGRNCGALLRLAACAPGNGQCRRPRGTHPAGARGRGSRAGARSPRRPPGPRSARGCRLWIYAQAR